MMAEGPETTQQKHGRRSISFAAGLQPLLVEQQPGSNSIFRTSGLIAATPHTPINRKLFTDRCRSKIILRPASARPAARSTSPLAPTAAMPQVAARPRSTSPSLVKAAAPGGIYWAQQLPPRCSTAPCVRRRPQQFGAALTSVLPEVLQFDSWHEVRGQGHVVTAIDYWTATGEFHIKRAHTHTAPLASHASTTSSRHSLCSAAWDECECAAAARGDRELWLSMQGAGRRLTHWDLHVGAELDVCGRRVVLKRASCATLAWLDAWATLLLKHKERLESQLLKFAPVVSAAGLRHKAAQQHIGFDQAVGRAEGPSSGQINLQHLRMDVAELAARLRHHMAAVVLPKELQDLQPDGPDNWSIDNSLSPQAVVCPPMTPVDPKHVRASKLLQRASRTGSMLPSLGETPVAANKLEAINRVNLLTWLDSIPLAASAAADRRSSSVTVQTPGSSKTPGAGGPLTSKRAPLFTSRSRPAGGFMPAWGRD